MEFQAYTTRGSSIARMDDDRDEYEICCWMLLVILYSFQTMLMAPPYCNISQGLPVCSHDLMSGQSQASNLHCKQVPEQ